MTTREKVWVEAYNAALAAGILDNKLRVTTANEALEDFNAKFYEKSRYVEKSC